MDNIQRLREILESLRIDNHYECEDCFYSCPKLGEDYCGISDDECTCGMDENNAKIEEALAILDSMVQ